MRDSLVHSHLLHSPNSLIHIFDLFSKDFVSSLIWYHFDDIGGVQYFELLVISFSSFYNFFRSIKSPLLCVWTYQFYKIVFTLCHTNIPREDLETRLNF